MTKTNNNELSNGVELPLMEAFLTVQGEGYFAGQLSYFLRIGGCDVGCHWCDVKESWDPNLHPLTKVDDIIKEIGINPVKIVVITGGEPLMWNLDYLCKKLKSMNIQIHLETSGAYPLSGFFDWICLSPKKTQLPLDDIQKIADELKVIISNNNDLEWALSQQQNINDECKLYLQPEWSKKEMILPKIIDFVKLHSEWIISLQTHKYMNIP
jgi:7-carboxy-7-deazaguanine synthase|tara:strand:+ start:4672 stop:5304 length:633 start_codon:yes stop_codon:yes gene_type:complete